jgi:hypothetical protein
MRAPEGSTLASARAVVDVQGMRRAALVLASCIGLGSAALGCADDGQRGERFADETEGQAEAALVVCAPDDVVYGIDVSYYQGDIDWSAVAADGYAFAITRINHADFMDPKFDANWAAIKDVGLVRGAYQYFEPGDDPVWQAEVVVAKVGKLGPGDLPVVIDVETTSGLTDPSAIVDSISAWMDIVEVGTGKQPIVYTGKYFWQDNVASDAFADYPLWHAQYPNACQPPAAPPPACGCANVAVHLVGERRRDQRQRRHERLQGQPRGPRRLREPGWLRRRRRRDRVAVDRTRGRGLPGDDRGHQRGGLDVDELHAPRDDRAARSCERLRARDLGEREPACHGRR